MQGSERSSARIGLASETPLHAIRMHLSRYKRASHSDPTRRPPAVESGTSCLRGLMWAKHPLTNCWHDGHGAEEVDTPWGDPGSKGTTLEACQASCIQAPACEAVIFSRTNDCYRKRDIDLSKCSQDFGMDLYIGLTRAPPPPAPLPPSSLWTRYEHVGCSLQSAQGRVFHATSLGDCQMACLQFETKFCQGLLYSPSTRDCFHQKLISRWECSPDSNYDLYLRTDMAVPVPSLVGMVQPRTWWCKHPITRSCWHPEFEMLDALRSRVSRNSRIAVVGSSGNLLHRGHGPAIDAHDVIVRMNSAGVVGFEKDVGKHTSLRIGWNQGFVDASRKNVIGADELLILTQPNLLDDQTWDDEPNWDSWWDKMHLEDFGRTNSLVTIEGEWAAGLHQVQLEGKGAWPSTGFVALAMAVALARDVGAAPPSVFGFGACEPCPKYYEVHLAFTPTTALAQLMPPAYLPPATRQQTAQTYQHACKPNT